MLLLILSHPSLRVKEKAILSGVAFINNNKNYFALGFAGVFTAGFSSGRG